MKIKHNYQPNLPFPRSVMLHEEDEEWNRGDWTVIAGVLLLAWVLYWLVIHWLDHFMGNWLKWYWEPLTLLLWVPPLVFVNIWGKDPRAWWPIVCGHRVELTEQQRLEAWADAETVEKRLGGPQRCKVYVQLEPNDTYVKFRYRKDAVWYTMFPDSFLKLNRRRQRAKKSK